MAMFEFLIVFVLSTFALTVLSAAGAIALHAILGPSLPPSAQLLADTLMSVYTAGAAGFLGAFRLLRRDNAISNDHVGPASINTTTPRPTDPKRIATSNKQARPD